ncbi:MAG TPA: hypothetical protein VMS54_10130 [Vicinamibacterales bacterium]|nr:hypothetical protein [Vicinamibacterales bacterium]
MFVSRVITSIVGAAFVIAAVNAQIPAPPPSTPAPGEPIVSVWYRGTPAGTPRQSDLGAIRALGFNGVTWPKSAAAQEAELRRLAALVGLVVEVVDKPRLAGPTSALTPGSRIDIVVGLSDGIQTPALAWRAIAHGARTIAFDSGDTVGAGLDQKDGSLRPWARPAIAIARQLTGNSRLVRILKPGPGILLSPPREPVLDVVLLDGDRSWVLVATNVSPDTLTTSARLPAGAPYAMWISWVDGATLAMIDEPAGPRWNFQIGPGAARVYLIDKILK